MEKIFGVALTVVFAGMGCVQFLAIWDGAEAVLGLSSFAAIVLSLFLAWIPLVGSVLGVFGAHETWGWSWMASIALFTWWIVASGVIVAVDAFGDDT